MAGPSDFDQEELMLMLQDALMMVAAGRTDGIRCPVCDRADLDCQSPDEDGWVRVQCPGCNLNFEGLLGNSEGTIGASKGKASTPFG